MYHIQNNPHFLQVNFGIEFNNNHKILRTTKNSFISQKYDTVAICSDIKPVQHRSCK